MKFWRIPLVIGAALILGWTAQGADAQLISGCPNANLADAFGNLAVTNLNGGISASPSTVWRGDGTWAIPAGSDNVTGPPSSVSGDIATFSGTSGMALQATGTQFSALAPPASPSFTKTPVAPTAATATNTAQIATTAYVQNQAYATLALPALNGTATAPTPAQGTNSTQIATTAFVKSQRIPISIGWIAGENPNNAIASVINQAMTINAIVGAVEVANGSAGDGCGKPCPERGGLFGRDRAPFRQFQCERHRSDRPDLDGDDSEPCGRRPDLSADDRRQQLEFGQRCRHHHHLCDAIIMKQLLTYVLTLAVILGAATAASERPRAFLLIGQTPIQSSHFLLLSPGVTALANTGMPLKVQ